MHVSAPVDIIIVCYFSEKVNSGFWKTRREIYEFSFFSLTVPNFFIETKTLRSKIGIDDLEEYKTSKATLEELKMQNSYFVAELVNKQENDK